MRLRLVVAVAGTSRPSSTNVQNDKMEIIIMKEKPSQPKHWIAWARQKVSFSSCIFFPSRFSFIWNVHPLSLNYLHRWFIKWQMNELGSHFAHTLNIQPFVLLRTWMCGTLRCSLSTLLADEFDVPLWRFFLVWIRTEHVTHQTFVNRISTERKDTGL